MSLTLGAAWRQTCQRIDRLDARLLIETLCACTHAELIAHGGLYARLWQHQTGGFVGVE